MANFTDAEMAEMLPFDQRVFLATHWLSCRRHPPTSKSHFQPPVFVLLSRIAKHADEKL